MRHLTLVFGAILSLTAAQVAFGAFGEDFSFDTNGAGANPPGGVTVMDTFDWAPGNSLAVRGNTAINNFIAGAGDTTFDLYYQAKLSQLQINGGNVANLFNLSGVGADELTVVAGFTENVTFANGPAGIAQFGLAAGTPSYLDIYYSPKNASDLAGQN